MGQRAGRRKHAARTDPRRERPARGRALEAALAFVERHRRLVTVLLVGVALLVGLAVRLEDLRDWHAQPERGLYQGKSLITSFDGYYYLGLARDLLEGSYEPVDPRRSVPEGMPRPQPPPLLSVLGATATWLTPASLDQVAAMLPVLLSLLLALPLYALGRQLGGRVMATTAVLMALLANQYAERCGVGSYDTDCLNVTIPLAEAWCFLRFALDRSRRRYLYAGAGLLLLALHLWWWDQAPLAALGMAVVPFTLAIVLFYRVPRREALVFAAILLALAVATLGGLGMDAPRRAVDHVVQRVGYVMGRETGDVFPPIGETVAEQAAPSFREVVAETSATLPAFMISLIGMTWLGWRRPTRCALLVAPACLGLLGVFYALRFLMFLSPLLALGFGYVAQELWRLRTRAAYLAVVAPAMVIAAAWFACALAMRTTIAPAQPPCTVAGLEAARRLTPEDAVVWAIWDQGYAVSYWARRGTVDDGEVHGGARTYLALLPLVLDDDRCAANLMTFLVSQGVPGFEKLAESMGGDDRRAVDLLIAAMAAGPLAARDVVRAAEPRVVDGLASPEEWTPFLFPSPARPVYLLLDCRLPETTPWWSWVATWDFGLRKGTQLHYALVGDLHEQGGLLAGSGGFGLDPGSGRMVIADQQVQLRSATFHAPGSGARSREYTGTGGPVFEAWGPGRFGAVMDPRLADSLFNRLFLRHAPSSRYFRQVDLRAPQYQLWEVRGDSHPAAKP